MILDLNLNRYKDLVDFRYYMFSLHLNSKNSRENFICQIHLSHHTQILAVNATRGPGLTHCRTRCTCVGPSFYDSRHMNPHLAISSFPSHCPQHMSVRKQSQSHDSPNTSPCFSMFTLICCYFYFLSIYGSERYISCWW